MTAKIILLHKVHQFAGIKFVKFQVYIPLTSHRAGCRKCISRFITAAYYGINDTYIPRWWINFPFEALTHFESLRNYALLGFFFHFFPSRFLSQNTHIVIVVIVVDGRTRTASASSIRMTPESFDTLMREKNKIK